MSVMEGAGPAGTVTSATPTAPASRRYFDLDWLRLFALLFVFLYHSAKPFGFDSWHINNAERSAGFDAWLGLLAVWIIPVLFFVSGMSIALSFRERSAGQFVRERLQRLLVPFLLGVFVLAPPQVYVERISRTQFAGSLPAFLPHYFDGLYLGYGGTGNFAWHGLHLWYLGVLLLSSLLLLPLFLSLRGEGGRYWLARLGGWLRKPGAIFLPAIPLMLLSGGLDPATLGRRDLGEWNVFIYPVLISLGFVLTSSTNFSALAWRYRWIALPVGFVPGAIAEVFDGTTYGSPEYFIGFAARALFMWCLIVSLVGFFYSLRDRRSYFLGYASEMGMPFYILHQPIILAVDLVVLQLNLPPIAKYGIIVATCLPLVVLTYEALVRRFNPVRFLFGMRRRWVARTLLPQTSELLVTSDYSGDKVA